MGDEPTALGFARSLVKDGMPVPVTVAKALLEYVDRLRNKLDQIDEDTHRD